MKVLNKQPEGDDLNFNESGHLYGFFGESELANSFYVLGCTEEFEILPASYQTIGTFNKEENIAEYFFKENWISLRVNSEGINIQCVRINSLVVTCCDCRFVLYDKASFLHSELFISSISGKADPQDYFKVLAQHVKLVFNCSTKKSSSQESSFLFFKFLDIIILVAAYVKHVLSKIHFILKYTCCGIHFSNILENVIWFLNQYRSDEKLSLQGGNCLLSLILDAAGGILLLYMLMIRNTQEDIYCFISNCTEVIVSNITLIVEWLMGSPAGLKLNAHLNEIVGGFFLYNVNLWHSFLGITRPVLELSFRLFLTLGVLGVSFQIAVLADVFAIGTFNVYSIYVYAARLYDVQLSGLGSLSRLFLGRKRNPEPGRIDSCPYTTEQLFIGTISFTVLLFLLPTILVYYIVFATIRVGVVGLGGLMTRTRYLIQIIPLYSTLVWLFNPKRTSMTVVISPQKPGPAGSAVVLCAKLVPSTWWETVRLTVPAAVRRPPEVQWTPLLRSLATGKLIYPF